ncbi:MAG: hypothetical protein K6G80_11410 [Treponema sp.]|nr:hypothetical protein [Treponema sp.]
MLFLFSASAASDSEYQRLHEFLAGYLQNDLELQKLSLTVQSKQLLLDSTKIDNGISLTLASGTVTVRTTGSSYTKVTFEPTATLSLPQLNDTTVSADVPVTVLDGEKTVSDATLSLSTAIISNAAKSRKVTLLKAERALLEAKRNAQDRALAAEKAFYTELKTLYGYAVTVIGEKNDLLDDSDSFRKIVAQGYSKDSAAYRKSLLTVQHDIFDTAQAQRKLERETANFARKCGIPYTLPLTTEGSTLAELELAYQNAMAFLPDALPVVEGIDVLSFEKADYAAIESSLWSHYIGDKEREADGTFSLKATGTYTFNNTGVDSDTVGTGLALSWNGLTASAGVALPTGTKVLTGEDASDSKNPVYTFSLALVPNTFRQASISSKQDVIDGQLEKIAVASAEDSYETDVFTQQTSLRDLLWSKHLYAEENNMYTALEKDMKAWLSEGIVTQADYFDARDNRDKTRLNILINAAEFIIYNNTTRLLFHTDGAMVPGKELSNAEDKE